MATKRIISLNVLAKVIEFYPVRGPFVAQSGAKRKCVEDCTCLRRCPRCFGSESALNATTLRLWSDSGGEHVLSTPFDDLGAWHSAEAKSFLHNVSLDNVGHISHTGLRETNEDSYKLVELEPDFYYFAVFDGHGGSAAVDFVSEHLHECVKHFCSHDKNLESVLTKAFLKCNRDLEEYFLFLNERGKQRIMAIFLINGSNLENTRDYYVVKIFVDIFKS